MSRGTKKVGRAGRFGPRYGTSVRRRVKAIEEVQFKTHRCPQCLTGELKRVSTSVWLCRKCDHKFAGGAYQPRTESFGRAKASADVVEEITEAFEHELEEEEEEAAEPEIPAPAEPSEAEPTPDEAPDEAPEEPAPSERSEEDPPEAEDEPREDEADEPEIESLFED